MVAQPNSPEEEYYYIDQTKMYVRSRPHPSQNLISLYNLDTIAHSVARLNADGTKGVKLRKSYKAHISGVAMDGVPISTDRTLSPIVFAPEREGAAIRIETLDQNRLRQQCTLVYAPDGTFPDFDKSQLAMADSNGSKRKAKSKGPEDPSKKRRVE